MARLDKFKLHKPYIQNAIYKQQQLIGRSLLFNKFQNSPEEIAKSRTMALFNDEITKWYDPNEICQSVSYEPIATVEKSRKIWERKICEEKIKRR
uniref:Uncharacterized protein n=1 Tax=Meloidogyne enterolobii TaxID=390850 RepID=A0A6V7WS58_MELEN|nr:unnamed protein product [Meloidogyne enterolobii]